MKVAVIGMGVSGLMAAWSLARAGVDVVVYEKEDYLGGHTRTVEVDGVAVDIGFMVFNHVTYPNMLRFFEETGVEIENSDMSFSVSLDEGRGCEWSSNGISGLFAQKKNLLNPFFLQMIKEIIQFQSDVLHYLERLERNDPGISANETLGQFLKLHGYSIKFITCYLIPMCASIWSCSSQEVLGFSAAAILKFCKNHHLLQILGRPQWLTVKGRSRTYVEKLVKDLVARGGKIRKRCTVVQVSTSDQGVRVVDKDGKKDYFNRCIIGAHAPDALEILGENATDDERRILGSFQYTYSDIYVHRDAKLMPKSSAAWAAWNFLGCQDDRVCVTYWLNILQNLGDTGRPILVTLNPSKTPQDAVFKWRTSHPIPLPAAVTAANELHNIQGKRAIWFCGAYQGYGFHEDGLKSGLIAAMDLLGETFKLLKNVHYAVPSWSEYAARLVVLKFLRQYIKVGYLQFQETGGPIMEFGVLKINSHKSILRVHRPSFYWKIATRADLGLADAFIDGDFSFEDPDEGLLNLFLILIDNRDNHQSQRRSSRRGWWSPVMFTAIVGSAASYLKHYLRGNTLTNARRNIAAHYDLVKFLHPFSSFFTTMSVHLNAL